VKVLKGLGGAVIALAMVACTQPTTPSNKAPLANTFDSADAMARAVVALLARRDASGLKDLALSEAEFRSHVWPELDTSRPERNVPFDYAWGQMKQRSDGSLQNTLARYGGQQLTVRRTSFTGETTQYQSFAVMRESEVVAADATGRELVLHLYGSAMVKDGRYKVFSFVVDD